MRKNILTGVILAFAVIIVVLNLTKPSDVESEKKKTVDRKEESAISDFPEDTSGYKVSPLKVGAAAPDFHLETLDGKQVKLSDYRGKKVILNLWATWCPPCRAEMPHMQKFYEKNKDNDIVVLAVNLTSMDNGEEKIKDFVKKYGLTFPIPLDKTGDIGEIYQAYTIPTSYVITPEGKIKQKIIGPMDEEMMAD